MSFDAAHEEDRPLLRNVVAGIQALKKGRVLTSWSVTLGGGCYLVTAFVADGVDIEFGSREIDMLHDISPLRVVAVSVGRIGGKLVLTVRVSDKDEPLMLTETQVVHVRKRSRWLNWWGGGTKRGKDGDPE